MRAALLRETIRRIGILHIPGDSSGTIDAINRRLNDAGE